MGAVCPKQKDCRFVQIRVNIEKVFAKCRSCSFFVRFHCVSAYPISLLEDSPQRSTRSLKCARRSGGDVMTQHFKEPAASFNTRRTMSAATMGAGHSAPFMGPIARPTPKTDTGPVALPTEKFSLYRHMGKRVMDIVLVLAASPIVFLVIAVMALFVSRDGHNPFYSQKRVGRGGKTYRMWKMRTMVPNAKAQLDDYLAQNPEAATEWDAHQKLMHDPRITRVGRILRKTSIDELPQLLNVLKGEMSIVGPRPMMPEQRAMYPGTDYYSLRPGITGPWQVSSRNESTFAGRARFDALYNRKLSFATDIRMIMMTVKVVCRATGH